MILTIDIGNTNKKYSLFQNEMLLEQNYWKDLSELPKFERSIISNVTNTEIDLANSKQVSDYFRPGHFIDMPVQYEQSLGEDRLVGCYYAYKKSELPCAIIDTGTFTTCDLVTSSGYMGGIILPGRALIENTYNQGVKLHPEKLEAVSLNQIPTCTSQAIKMGVYLSLISPIVTWLKQHPVKSIIFTGGNSEVFVELLGPDLTCDFHTEKNLMHLGLYLIAKEAQ